MTTDNPIKQWIEERRAIHEAATEGPWVADYSGETGDCVIPHDAQSTREAVAVTRLFHRTADANAIADAHNHLPAFIQGWEVVLGLHQPVLRGNRYVCEHCHYEDGPVVTFPCLTVRALEDAWKAVSGDAE